MTHSKPMGLSGRLAALFIRSKLSILLIVFALIIGCLAIGMTPKEDEPQITVCMADVLIAYPGHGEKEVDERIARPVGSWIREIPTVDHVMSSSSSDGTLLVVQFKDGVAREQALVQLYDRLRANLDRLPPGVPSPLVKPRGVEDVPDLNLVLSSATTDTQTLRRLAWELGADLRKLPEVSRIDVLGGASRTIRVDLDAKRLTERGLSAAQVVQAVQAGNVLLPGGTISGPQGTFRVEAGGFLTSAEDVSSLIIGATGAGPVYLRDVAQVADGITDPSAYVTHLAPTNNWASRPAVTLAATKLKGSNAAEVTREMRSVLEQRAKGLLPADVQMSFVHDSGKNALESVDMALEHLAIAVVVAIALVAVSLGWREGAVTAIVLPITLLSIPMAYAITGFSLNRITLAAMVFAIGLLIDNAIVVIENIHRHFMMKDAGSKEQIAARATQEIGAPTILATIMVVMALVPTAFVSGMIGQYLRALPIGASIGMAFSLFIALSLVPYLCTRFLGREHLQSTQARPSKGHTGRILSWYHIALSWVLDKPKRMLAVYAVGVVLLGAAVALLPLRVATFRLVGGKDQEAMSVLIDMPAHSSLEGTDAVVVELARQLQGIPEVASCQTYVGAPGPLAFQGVARHYDQRTQPYQAEIQIQLQSDRHRSSQRVALAVRERLQPMLSREQATFSVAEIPSGPPTLAVLVAEVYAPDDAGRLALAQLVKRKFEALPGVVDVDWSGRPGPRVARLKVLPQQAAMRGVVTAQTAMNTRILYTGDQSAWAHLPSEREPVAITVAQNRTQRATVEDLQALTFTPIMGGAPVPAAEISRVEMAPGTAPLMRMDLQPVIMVTANVTGAGPLYKALDISRLVKREAKAAGITVETHLSDGSPAPQAYWVKWTGDWSTQRDLLRDLAGAFAIVLLLIYAMLVAWYESFLTPIVIMLPIPLILVGVIPIHPLLGMPIDATGLIGIIALAGIMVRNSILLVDFASSKIAEGLSVREAIIRASRTRLRPIVLTALAVLLGESVLIHDSLLKSLGIALVFGGLVSTTLTLLIVPVAYYQMESFRQRLVSRKASKSKLEVHG